MAAGVSTACFYPEYTEDSLRQLADMGVGVCEIFINSTLELEEAYVRGLRSIVDSSGMRVSAMHPSTGATEPFLFFSRYERRFEEGLELFRRFYYAAASLGAKIVVFHGNNRQNPIEPNDYFDRFERLHTEAKRFGVELCQENVERCDSRHSDFFIKMKAAMPDVRYVFDLKQAIRSDEDIMDFSGLIMSNIAHVHMSDHSPAQDCLLPGTGTFNIKKFLDLMRKNGNFSDVIVEVYRENFGDLVEIWRSYQLLCAMLST